MNASLKLSLSAVIALALATPALAQDSRKPTSSGTSTGGTETPRGGSSAGSGSSGSTSSGGSNSGGSTVSSGDSRGPSQSRPAREPQTGARRPSGQAAGAGPDIPAYSRPRNGAPVRGTVVERGNNPLPPRGGYTGGYYGYPGYYDYYYGSPYRFAYYPVYTGFGHFYYDPYWSFYGPAYNYGYGYSGGGDRGDRHYGIGSLRLKIDPSQGEVYVDGLYRGVVDDFDGVFQRLKLEAGALALHRIVDGVARREEAGPPTAVTRAAVRRLVRIHGRRLPGGRHAGGAEVVDAHRVRVTRDRLVQGLRLARLVGARRVVGRVGDTGRV
jgi:hypothetical protein